MTTKVTNAFPPQGTIPTEMSLTTNSPHQSTEFLSARPDSLISSSSAALSPIETFILSRMRFNHPLSPAASVSRSETWSDSASEETYILYSPARDSNGLQILPIRPPGGLPTTPQQGPYTKFPSRALPEFSQQGL